MADGSIKKNLLEHLRISKEQKEPILAGSEYVLTKQVTQAYEESIKYCQEKVSDYERQIKELSGTARQARLVGAGFKIKGYALVIPVHDDYDMAEELEAAISSLKLTFGLQAYLDGPKNHGKFVLYPYEVKELSIIFQDFNTYNFVEELDNMLRAFQASYGRQMYSGALEKLKLAISWEVNHAMTKGNEELALRMKESDTTLMLGIAANPETESKPKVYKKPEPTREEVETGLQEMASKDLEIRAPSQIPTPMTVEDKSVAIDCVNESRRVRKHKIKARTSPHEAKTKVNA